MNGGRLISYLEVLERSGLSRRVLYDRLKETGIPTYRDGKDRRLRLIAAADLPRLTDPLPVRRREIAAETTP